MSTIVESERCSLRELRRSDLEDLAAFMMDEAVFQYELSSALSRGEVEDYLEDLLIRYRLENHPFYEYGIELKSEEKIIGTISFTFPDPNQRICQFGYVLNPKYSGQGFLFEITFQFIKHLFENQVNKIIASCAFPNQKSWRLLEKLGFEKEGHIKEGVYVSGEYVDEVYYGYLKKDWEAR